MANVLSTGESRPVELPAFQPDYPICLTSTYSCFPGETSAYGEVEVANKFNLSLVAATHVCCSPDHRQADAITSFLATPRTLRMMHLAALPDGETALVSDLKLYLRCRRVNCSMPVRLNCGWDIFYDQCKKLVWEIVVSHCKKTRCSMEYEDVFQEVWHEIIVQLPKLVYDPTLGRLSSWLAGLTRKKISRLFSSQVSYGEQCSIELLGKEMPALALEPEENYSMQEMQGQLNAGLFRFRRKVSPKNYDLFCWRFFLGQSYKEIASMSSLSTKAVRRRCDRMREKWRSLTRDLPLLDCARELNSAATPPPQIRSRE